MNIYSRARVIAAPLLYDPTCVACDAADLQPGVLNTGTAACTPDFALKPERNPPGYEWPVASPPGDSFHSWVTGVSAGSWSGGV